VVICYGKKNWRHYREIFPDVTWTAHPLSANTKAEMGVFKGRTTVVLSPFFVPFILGNISLTALCHLLQPAPALD
jgi:hypothetical protein